MLKSVIEKINYEFILEAKSSPKLMEDMASMEKYLAESYGGRTLIELLQNADDAVSKRVKIIYSNNVMFFANDGRIFNEYDVIAISRSGASSKQRGLTIGYRGVGFKSTSCITNEIIIYSDNLYFSFSKERCAKTLEINSNQVPTIRIPFLLQEKEITETIKNKFECLKNEGYSTVFAFKTNSIQQIEEEISDLSNGSFIFLRNIESVIININKYIKTFNVKRNYLSENRVIQIESNSIDKWLLVSQNDNNTTSIAFKLDNNKIIACDEAEAVFHCYLPTTDKTGYLFKVNSDFSTDPSRKHLSLDEITETAITKAAEILFNLIQRIVNNPNDNITFSNIFEILVNTPSFSKFAMSFKEQFKQLITCKEWLLLHNGTNIKPCEYKLFPEWIEESEKKPLRNISPYLRNMSLETKLYEQFQQFEVFIKNYKVDKMDTLDFIKILQDQAFVKNMNPLTIGKILGNCIKSSRANFSISKVRYSLDECFILNQESVTMIKDIKDVSTITLNNNIKEIINQIVEVSDLEWFCKEYNQMINVWLIKKPKTKISTSSQFFSSFTSDVKKNSVTKWRSAEQQCLEIETGFGNKANDISKQNLGYDIESKTPEGEMRYIEVKSLTQIGDSFTMTNNEYTAAHQYGDSYYLCIVSGTEDKLKALYIQNPLNCISFEKRVRQWEWYCDNYSGEMFVLDLK